MIFAEVDDAVGLVVIANVAVVVVVLVRVPCIHSKIHRVMWMVLKCHRLEHWFVRVHEYRDSMCYWLTADVVDKCKLVVLFVVGYCKCYRQDLLLKRFPCSCESVMNEAAVVMMMENPVALVADTRPCTRRH